MEAVSTFLHSVSGFLRGDCRNRQCGAPGANNLPRFCHPDCLFEYYKSQVRVRGKCCICESQSALCQDGCFHPLCKKCSMISLQMVNGKSNKHDPNKKNAQQHDLCMNSRDCNWHCKSPWNPSPIKFYNRHEAYFEFTNFFICEVLHIDGKDWRSTEHYFQAQKFIGTPYLETIRCLETPREAFEMSRQRDISIWRRSDWDAVKEIVMYKALLHKFGQNAKLKKLLVKTGNRDLIENSPYDSYWGCGRDGKGKNRLGIILMKVRDCCLVRVGDQVVTMQHFSRPAAQDFQASGSFEQSHFNTSKPQDQKVSNKSDEQNLENIEHKDKHSQQLLLEQDSVDCVNSSTRAQIGQFPPEEQKMLMSNSKDQEMLSSSSEIYIPTEDDQDSQARNKVASQFSYQRRQPKEQDSSAKDLKNQESPKLTEEQTLPNKEMKNLKRELQRRQSEEEVPAKKLKYQEPPREEVEEQASLHKETKAQEPQQRPSKEDNFLTKEFQNQEPLLMLYAEEQTSSNKEMKTQNPQRRQSKRQDCTAKEFKKQEPVREKVEGYTSPNKGLKKREPELQKRQFEDQNSPAKLKNAEPQRRQSKEQDFPMQQATEQISPIKKAKAFEPQIRQSKEDSPTEKLQSQEPPSRPQSKEQTSAKKVMKTREPQKRQSTEVPPAIDNQEPFLRQQAEEEQSSPKEEMKAQEPQRRQSKEQDCSAEKLNNGELVREKAQEHTSHNKELKKPKPEPQRRLSEEQDSPTEEFQNQDLPNHGVGTTD